MLTCMADSARFASWGNVVLEEKPVNLVNLVRMVNQAQLDRRDLRDLPELLVDLRALLAHLARRDLLEDLGTPWSTLA